MRLAAHGVSAELPAGWDGRIFRRPDGAPVAHFASFALHASDGDFGGAATGRMRPDDAFVALLEYRVDGPLRPGEGLFAAEVPSRLRATDFSARQLQVTRRGHVGAQRFFTHRGRPFCLYVVLHPVTHPLPVAVRRVSAVLATLRVD